MQSEHADELLHSPTEPDTPSDSGGETHDSFTSLINYDPSSQHIAGPQQSRRQQHHPQFLHDHSQPPPSHYPPQHEQHEQHQQHHQQQPPSLVFPTVSHAETLRLRLQVAMYKIRTNQVNVPFAELQIDNDERAEGMNRHRVSEAVEAAVATMRREAMESMPRSTYPAPTLIPGPLLYPTAYSSRTIQQPEPQAHDLGPLAAASLFMSDMQAQGSNVMPGL
jgi:hypothetical protein